MQCTDWLIETLRFSFQLDECGFGASLVYTTICHLNVLWFNICNYSVDFRVYHVLAVSSCAKLAGGHSTVRSILTTHACQQLLSKSVFSLQCPL